jgi:hypothetical protein
MNVRDFAGGKGDPRQVHILVDTTNVLVQVLANGRELASIHADHAEPVDLDR